MNRLARPGLTVLFLCISLVALTAVWNRWGLRLSFLLLVVSAMSFMMANAAWNSRNRAAESFALARGALLASPALFGAAFILTTYADVGQVLESLPRPLLLTFGLALVLQGVASLVLRDRYRGAVVALIALTTIIDLRVALLVVVAWLIIRELSRRQGWRLTAGSVGVVILIVFSISFIRLVSSPAFQPGDIVPSVTAEQAEPMARSATSGPDIFLLMLDAYPRSDSLASHGYDNESFEVGLRDRGFEVATKSHSNYEFTYLALPTMFHMAHASTITGLANVPEVWINQRRAIRDAMDSPPGIEGFRAHGYRILSTGMPASILTLRGVDEYFDSGKLNQFEQVLIGRTSFSGVLSEFVLSQHKERVVESLQATVLVASDPHRTFMFTHILSPHVPFVFDRRGELPDLPCGDACDRFTIYAEESGMTVEEFAAAYSDQVHHLNSLVLDTVDNILDTSPDATVIVFSDHGARSDRTLSDEWFASFFAARSPGHEGLFSDNARPIEILPRLLAAHFGDQAPIPADTNYYSPARGSLPLEIERWIGGAARK